MKRKYMFICMVITMLIVLITGCQETADDTVVQDTNELIDDSAIDDTSKELEEIIEEPEVVEPEPEGVLSVVDEAKAVSINDTLYMDYKTTNHISDREPVKGIYVSGYTAGIKGSLDNLLTLADDTEVNAFVIDVKSDDGRILFDVDHPIIDEIGAEYKAISDIDYLMDRLYEHDVFPIARIVAFKDPFLASKKQDYAIKNQDGSLFYYGGIAWLNPYNTDTWTYIVDVAKLAAEAGFKEIQFDYIRFEATRKLNNADFGDIDESVTRRDIIVQFLEYAEAELEPYDVELSADVFGAIITSEVDAKTIGQDYYRMSEHLDVICPMVYPSHYALNSYGAAQPDLAPYTIIYGSMMDSNEVLQDLIDQKEITVRPWLQAFTASYLQYDPNYEYMYYGGPEMRIQMEAAYDAGLEEWILWDPANTYPYSAFLTKEELAAQSATE